MEDEASVDDIIFVKKGSLRVDKQLTFESQNIMPSQLKGDDGRRQWDVNRITTEKKITTLIIPTLKFFGLHELLNDKNF